jgi:ABC-type phosphate/phosphonate transport system substrate-binding protein
VQLVAMPDNRLPGCPPGHYNSVFICRVDDPRMSLPEFADAPFAFSEPLSQSGWAAPQNHAAGLGFAFSNDIYTGAHIHSASAVAERRADIACIDALSWRLIQRHDAHAASLQEITRTVPTPAPPFITGPGRDVDIIRAALAGGIDALSLEGQETIGLFGLAQVPEAAYMAVANPAPPRTPKARI